MKSVDEMIAGQGGSAEGLIRPRPTYADYNNLRKLCDGFKKELDWIEQLDKADQPYDGHAQYAGQLIDMLHSTYQHSFTNIK
jgi:hypothetical protein